MARPWLALLLAGGLAACASPAVVFLSRTYDTNRVRRVALVDFADYPGLPGSGEIAASTFEKHLLWAGYGLAERRQVEQILKEQTWYVSGAIDPVTVHSLGKLLGVDAVAFGSLTDFRNVREQTVMVDVPQEQTEPIYGEVETIQQNGSTLVKTRQPMVVGYSTTQTMQMVPEIATLPAHVGMSVRLVAVDTGEVLWSASGSSDGVDLTSAAEEASSKIMQALVKVLNKAAKKP